MANRTAWRVGAMALAAPAAAQPVLYGAQGNGDLVWISSTAGAGVLFRTSGYLCNAAAGYSRNFGRSGGVDDILLGGGPGALADQIIAVNRATGAAGVFLNTTGRPPGFGIHAMTPSPFQFAYNLYVILSTENPSAIRTLASIDLLSGVYTVIGPTGRSDLEALAQSPAGVLYALGSDGGGTLCMLNTATGAATPIGGGGFGNDTRALAFLLDGRLVACGTNLLNVNPSTGATTLIGPTGFTDIRGLAVIGPCYVNCDYGGPPPVLNVLDFLCFLNRFAAGDIYANCDESVTPPVLNVLDFMCFLNRFASLEGCP